MTYFIHTPTVPAVVRIGAQRAVYHHFGHGIKRIFIPSGEIDENSSLLGNRNARQLVVRQRVFDQSLMYVRQGCVITDRIGRTPQKKHDRTQGRYKSASSYV